MKHATLKALIAALAARGIALPVTLDEQLLRERLRVAILKNRLELMPVDPGCGTNDHTYAAEFRHLYGEFLDRRARRRDGDGRPEMVRAETPRPDDEGDEDEESRPRQRKANFATLSSRRRGC